MKVQAAESLINSLIRQHLGSRAAEWRWTWTRWRRTAGRCDHPQRVLFFSWPVFKLNTEEECRQVVLHEVAHAVTGEGHTETWLWKARELGYRYGMLLSRNIVMPAGKWETVCGTCGAVQPRYRKPTRGVVLACTHCLDNGKVVTLGVRLTNRARKRKRVMTTAVVVVLALLTL